VALNPAGTAGEAAEQPPAALGPWLARALGAEEARITLWQRLSGGAVQDNRALDVVAHSGGAETVHRLVLRTDAPAGLTVSRSRAEEFAVLGAVHAAGVAVPRPVALCTDPAVLGRPFYVMERLPGVAAGHLLVRDDRFRGDRAALARRLGAELARLHGVRPPRTDLAFLGAPPADPARAAVAEYRAWLDTQRAARPALEWGLRWLDRMAPAPPPGGTVLCHRDFRTGNFLVEESGLAGILDWEFAGWSDPHEDLGWFCAKCWRFGALAREAGGIGAREDLYRGYEEAGGGPIDRAAVAYWETMAHARWAVISLQQGERHVSGIEPSLHLALTGRMVAEIELDRSRWCVRPLGGSGRSENFRRDFPSCMGRSGWRGRRA